MYDSYESSSPSLCYVAILYLCMQQYLTNITAHKLSNFIQITSLKFLYLSTLTYEIEITSLLVPGIVMNFNNLKLNYLMPKKQKQIHISNYFNILPTLLLKYLIGQLQSHTV